MSETAELPAVVTASFATLPALKAPFAGGVFAGLTTKPEGTHFAIALLEARPEGDGSQAAQIEWAKSVGGQLPSPSIARLLFENCRDLLPDDWVWTDELYGSSYAWCCGFHYGYITSISRSAELGAVAVRLIPLIP